MPEVNETPQILSEVKVKPGFFANAERKRSHAEFTTAVTQLESFIREVGKHPHNSETPDDGKWHNVRTYDHPDTAFPWWEDPIAEGSIIELRQIKDDGVAKGAPILYIVGRKKEGNTYPVLYRYDADYLFGKEGVTVADHIKDNVQVLQYRNDSDKAKKIFQPIASNESSDEVHVWINGDTKKDKGNNKKHTLKRPIPSRKSLTPIPVPIPVE